MACCALAVMLLLQLLAPVRWLRGAPSETIAEETNWQLNADLPISEPSARSINWPRRYTHFLFPVMGVELMVLGVLLLGH